MYVHIMSTVWCSQPVVASIYKYFFIADMSNGVTIFHPQLAYPTVDDEDEPVIVPIQFLEESAYSAGIIDTMLRFDNLFSTLYKCFMDQVCTDVVFSF